jgi:hypothetical protein
MIGVIRVLNGEVDSNRAASIGSTDDGWQGWGKLTSGKVPLEKTLPKENRD